MRESTINYQKLCADLLEVIDSALYLMEIKKDPAYAAEILRAAQEQSVKSYLSYYGPIYNGGALDTPRNSC